MIPIKGFTLLETLISLFILSLILLGLDALQTNALQQAKAVYYFNVAREQIYSMVEQLQTTKGSNTEILQMEWNEQNLQVLPQGKGQVINQNPYFILTLAWGSEMASTCLKNKIGISGCIRLITKIKTRDE